MRSGAQTFARGTALVVLSARRYPKSLWTLRPRMEATEDVGVEDVVEDAVAEAGEIDIVDVVPGVLLPFEKPLATQSPSTGSGSSV